jgi:hypothetical protein
MIGTYRVRSSRGRQPDHNARYDRGDPPQVGDLALRAPQRESRRLDIALGRTDGMAPSFDPDDENHYYTAE